MSLAQDSNALSERGQRLFVAPSSMPHPCFEELCGCEPEEIYVYRHSNGKVRGYVCRISVNGKKSFRPVTPWRNSVGKPEWRVSDFEAPKPLFGLYDLTRSPNAPVLVVEGEKTADAAEELFPEHVVISWPGGAKAVSRADWRPLQGRNVTIWPDADEAGRDAAIKVSECLTAIGAASIKIAQLPAELPEGWDLADKIPASIKPEQVLSEAKPYRKKLVDYLLSACELASMNLPPREMIIAPFLPVNSINLVYGARGLGKTWVVLTMAKAINLGEDWIGFEVPKRRRVLYIDGEMPLADLKQRLEAIGVGRSDRIDILASEILFQDLRPLNIHLATDQQQITEMLFSLEQKGRRPALIIFDNLSALRAGVDENDNAALDGLLRWFLQLRHRGYSILLIHHAGKGGDQRGASRLEDFLDTTIKLDRLVDQQESTGASFNMAFTKTRGPGFKPAELRLTLTEDEDGILRWRYAEAQRREASDETLKAIHCGPKKDMKSRFQTQQDLADALKVQKSTISKHLKSLRKRGLVGASTSPITITEQGIKRLNAVGGG